MNNVFDPGGLDVHSRMYQAWAVPSAFPDEPQPVLKNWHPEDLIPYCGGEYAVAAYSPK